MLSNAQAALSLCRKGEAPPRRDWRFRISSDTKALYLLGVGGERFFETALSWVEAMPERQLIVLEENPDALRSFLQRDGAEAFCSHPRVHVELLAKECDAQLSALATYTCLMPQQFLAHPDSERGDALRERLHHHRITQDSIASKALAINDHFYRQFYTNLASLPGALHAQKLYGRFQGVPAIICGAGPSLDQVYTELGNLQDRALIVAGGSAITALTRMGVRPHLGAGLCSSKEEIHRFWQANSFDLPIAYRIRLHEEVDGFLGHERIYTNGCCGMPIVPWVEEQLGIEGEPLEDGPSIIYLATQLAHRFGCDPIIYVGMDLSYTDERDYASGVNAEESIEEGIQRTDIHGDPVTTKWAWVCEADLLGRLIAQLKGARFVNATDGGIGIPGVPNGLLGDLSSAWPMRDMDGMVRWQLAQAVMPEVTQSRVTKILNKIRASILRCIALSEELLAGGPVPVCEVELEEEIAYQRIFKPILEQRSHFLARIYALHPLHARQQERWGYLQQAAEEQLAQLEAIGINDLAFR